MTRNSRFTQLCEQRWRRKLTSAEEAELRALLAAHPEAQADWTAEAGLSDALDRLPNVPVSSNFTARVLQAIEREEAAHARRNAPSWWLFRGPQRWLPRLAFGAVVVAAGLLSYHEAAAARRAQLARSVALVSDVSSLPSPKILEDFDAIRALPPTPPADEQLLALLK
jgi:hypothetical protein